MGLLYVLYFIKSDVILSTTFHEDRVSYVVNLPCKGSSSIPEASVLFRQATELHIPGEQFANETQVKSLSPEFSAEEELHTPHPAFEDGTDRGFRNVGKPQYDAGEIPKRTYTTI